MEEIRSLDTWVAEGIVLAVAIENPIAESWVAAVAIVSFVRVQVESGVALAIVRAVAAAVRLVVAQVENVADLATVKVVSAAIDLTVLIAVPRVAVAGIVTQYIPFYSKNINCQ